MTDIHIPDYADLLRRAAANHAADATRYADCETKLAVELTRFEEWMRAEHARIQAELDEAENKAAEQLRAISQDWETRKRDVAEAGRQKVQHQRHATGAERAWRGWCHDEGIDPDAVPPLAVTGPMPAITAGPDPARAIPQNTKSNMPCPKCGGALAWVGEHFDELAHVGTGLEECPNGSRPETARTSGALPVVAPPAPTDPLTTRVDPLPAGGEPVQGPFQGDDTAGGGVAARPDGGGVNGDEQPAMGDEQDGDDRG